MKNRLSIKEWTKKWKKTPTQHLLTLFLLLVIGIVFMMIGNLSGDSKEKSQTMSPFSKTNDAKSVETFSIGKQDPASSINDHERQYEKQLSSILEEMAGVSDVTVMITLDASEYQVIERNRKEKDQLTTETDQKGGRRQIEDHSTEEQVVMIRTGNEEKPLVVKTEKPKVRGVLVVAKGAENIQVKKWIIEAVSRVLDVPTHRISVQPKK